MCYTDIVLIVRSHMLTYLDIVLFILLGLFLSRSTAIDDADAFFCKDSTSSLRGLAMLGIILHHIHNELQYGSFLLSSVGYLSTGLFFFISGYGNSLSLKKTHHVTFSWLKKRIQKIYIPFLITYCFYYLTDIVLFPSEVPSLKDVIPDLVIISLPNMVSWFPKIIILCYFLHWSFKNVTSKENLHLGAMGLAIGLYILMMRKLNIAAYWYNSVLCYPLGMLIASKKDTISTRLCSRQTRLIFFWCVVLAFPLFFALQIVAWYSQIACAITFSLICFAYTLLWKVKTTALSWIGIHSFEFYLIHLLCCHGFHFIIPASHYLYTFCVLVSSFALVWVYLTTIENFFPGYVA